MRTDPQHSFPSRPVALSVMIETELEKIVNSRLFKDAGSLRELLRYTVRETVAGRGGDLKEYLLGATVLRKGEAFDPKADPIVRVQMRRLRGRLERYYATEGRHDALVVGMPKGAYTPTFRIVAPGEAVTTHAGVITPHVVGRDSELAAVRAAFFEASAGRGRMLCFSGEPGIGKTTIVEAFLNELSRSDPRCHIARGRCSERLAGAEAYLPLLEALDSLLHQQGESLARVLRMVAPTWYVQVSPQSAAAAAVSGEAALGSQERLKRELMALVRELGGGAPLVLFVDDLHWADASTVDMVAYVAERIRTERVLIIGTYRPADLLVAEHPFVRAKRELMVHGVCHGVDVRFLTCAEVDRYLSLEFPRHAFPPELAQRLHAKTEGNPLFMNDLVRLLRDRAVLVEHDGCWHIHGDLAAVELSIPATVRSVIDKNIGALADVERRILSVAAVQGIEFDALVVARTLDMDAAEVEDHLERVDRVHGIVRLVGERELAGSRLTARYRFSHVLHQNVLYDQLTPARRSSASLAVARALAELHGDRKSLVAAELALLFEIGRDFAMASDMFLAAAENAARVYAAREAIALAARAVAAALKLEGRERWSRVMAARLLSATAHETLTELEEALREYDAAERAAEEMGDSDARVHVIFRKSFTLLLTKRLSDVRVEGQHAMALARAADSAMGLASSDAILGIERWASGEIPAATDHLDRAITVLRTRDPFDHAPLAVLVRGGVHTFALEHEEAERAIAWGRERAAARGTGFESLFALFFQARTRGNRGLLTAAADTLEEGLRLAELLGDRFWLPRIANTRGWILTELCDSDNALRVNLEAARMAQEIGDAEAECMARINAARDYLTLEEPQSAWEELEQARVRCEQDQWFRWVYFPRLQAEFARYWIARGDMHEAVSCARMSLEDAERTRSRKRIAWAHGLLGEIAVHEDRIDEARREYAAALDILSRYPCPTIEWRLLRSAARAAAIARDADASSELAARAAAVAQNLATSIRTDAARRLFLESKAVRELNV
jgi:tetratricopeptide (TPR) repeat protein